MQYGPCPYFLHGIFIFFRMQFLKAQRVFDIAVGIFLIPAQMVQFFEAIHIKFMIRQICYKAYKRAGGGFKPDNPQGNAVFTPCVCNIVHRDIAAHIAVALRKLRAFPLFL